MAEKIKQKHGGAIWRLAKGETHNPNGRPRKFISQLKKDGYKQSEIMEAIQVLISMQPDELAGIKTNPKSTVLEISVASAILKSIQKGDLNALETLLTRIYGKPKQEVDAKVEITNHTIKLKFGNNEE